MKIKAYCLFFLTSICFVACNKDGFITTRNATIQTTADTLRFDTVFTGLGSVTKSFTIINTNSRKIKITGIQLHGGSNSPFSINVNGSPGTTFSNINIDPGDSIYVFVKVTVDPTVATNPFLLQDSILIDYNGNNKEIFLQAYGQNARFIHEGIIDNDTTWNNELPYVIENNLLISKGTTLTIEKGTKIFVNARAEFVVDGTLICIGDSDKNERITFRGDRLDETYRDLPGAWPGIIFTSGSKNNQLKYTNLLNAYQAIVSVGGANNVSPLLLLEQCTITNAYDIGIYAINSSVKATNCLISQCGNDAQPGLGGSNILITGGGKYEFLHCSIATYSNYYQSHKQPSVFINNKEGANSAPLNANFLNSIIYGLGGNAMDELIVYKNATDNVYFTNCIYKVKDKDPDASFTECIKNVDPLFDSINTSIQLYNFHLRDNSPAINTGKTSAVASDLDGSQRPFGTKPDIGCYEKH